MFSTQHAIRNVPPVMPTSLVSAVEVWELDAEGTSLRWSSGVYGDHHDFEQVSREARFGKGEGLPGIVWHTRSPHIMHSLFTGQFLRAEEARRAGLSCGIAIPFFNDREFRGVLVFLCDDGHDAQGAFEIWSQNDRRELGLSSSYYANLKHFSRLSQFVKFPRGSGLPGQAWQMRFPRIVTSLPDSPAFMRGAGARADGLQMGLAIPCMKSAWELDSVVVLLSSLHTPLARGVEIWMRTESGTFRFHSGHFSECRDVVTSPEAAEQSLVQQVALAAKPIVFPHVSDTEPSRSHMFNVNHLDAAVGMPIFVGSVMIAVVTLYL